MGTAQVTKGGMVKLRGIYFQADNIRAAMLETGGIPVSDPELNRILDDGMVASIELDGKTPRALLVEAVPDKRFIPIEINMHMVPGAAGIPSGGWIYFAVPKKLIFNA